ncbi:hypothetical protein NDN01_25230 [Sphingomonas sp. QA11]|uniref:hypothetical protein n=1 Tax=Sphingomonas sp. QA11 TaxID=2950605 RepID=UPI00234A0FAA|nr:hypothetical protein [Sphingomonas sp. QA11]WCM27246.1 hypothetical protein NDN01_25230 [Sphingomonas sp. QA11]
MTRMTRGTLLKVAALCVLALTLCIAPAPRLSAGLEFRSLRLSLSVGGDPVHFRTTPSGNGQPRDISLNLHIGNAR